VVRRGDYYRVQRLFPFQEVTVLVVRPGAGKETTKRFSCGVGPIGIHIAEGDYVLLKGRDFPDHTLHLAARTDTGDIEFAVPRPGTETSETAKHRCSESREGKSRTAGDKGATIHISRKHHRKRIEVRASRRLIRDNHAFQTSRLELRLARWRLRCRVRNQEQRPGERAPGASADRHRPVP
jgi:hypothetical protein